MDDLISRRAAIDAVHKEFDECLVWDESGKHTADEVERILTDVPSTEPEHLVKESDNLVKGLVNDCISRQAAIEHLKKRLYETALNNVTDHPYYEEMADNRVSVWLKEVPSAQPEVRTEMSSANDTISRQEVNDMLKELTKKASGRATLFNSAYAYYRGAISDVYYGVKGLPSAQPEHTETHSCDYERTETHDLISRQAAIDSVCENCEYFYNEKLIQTIKDLPSAEPASRREWYMKGYRDAKPKWTPVSSESMPEDGVTVWVTIKGHDVIRCEDGETLEQAVARISKMRRVSEGFWCEDDKTWYNAGGYPMMVQPVAWMPMEVPEPYKE